MSRIYALGAQAAAVASVAPLVEVAAGPVTLSDLFAALALLESVAEAGDDAPNDALVEAQDAADVLLRALGDGERRGELVDAMARWAVGAKARAEGAAAEARALADTAAAKAAEAKRIEASRDRALRLAVEGLRTAGLKEARGSVYRLSIQRNGGKVPVLVTDAGAVPIPYRKPLPAPETMPPDKEAIRDALEAGLSVPGCSLGERGDRVVVR